jgi:hypothetical protein
MTDAKPALRRSLPVPRVDPLAHTSNLIDNDVHVGITVRISSGAGDAAFVIPDAMNVHTGRSPVYLTRPVMLQGAKLAAYLEKKTLRDKLDDKNEPVMEAGKVVQESSIPKQVMDLLKSSDAGCDAFYAQVNGPLLMSFSLNFNDGLIGALTQDEDLAALFEIEGVSARVFRCPTKEHMQVLEEYVTELTAERPAQLPASRPASVAAAKVIAAPPKGDGASADVQ